MIDLDEVEKIKGADKGQVIDSINDFPKQIIQAWEEASEVEFPVPYKAIDNIVIAGMGGSTLGADLLRHLFKDSLTVPVTIVNHYSLPESVGEKTLVILASYSGTTEEVLAAAEETLKKKAKITGVTIGEELGDFFKSNSLPAYIFNPNFNPSSQPRLGLGYTFIAMIAFLNNLGFLKVETAIVKEAVEAVTRFGEVLTPEFKSSGNPAKQMAKELHGKMIIVIAAEFLSGNAHVFANQTNENSKNFAAFFLLPELNHHLLEGTSNPLITKTATKFIFLESDLYSEKIKKRIEITKDVLEKQGIPTASHKLEGKNQLTQAFAGIVYSSWVTFYLGMLNGVDPVKIPWVDYFKDQLAKSN